MNPCITSSDSWTRVWYTLVFIGIYLQYQSNKTNCSRKKIEMPISKKNYINEKVFEGWLSDIIIGWRESPFPTVCASFTASLNPVNSEERFSYTGQTML